MLADTVLPSYLEAREGPIQGATGSMDDSTLRVGEVVLGLAPNNPLNNDPDTKGKQWVYIVNVIYRDGVGPRFVVPYRCTVADTFGALGDHVRHTVRQADVPQATGEFSNGAQVLVLCPNGDKGNALIVGGVRHRDDTSIDPNDTFWDFKFNGVNISIDKDGALKIVVPGATKVDGSPANDRDSNNHGSQVTFAKDGTIRISDENGESLRFSPSEKKVEILTQDLTVVAQGNVSVSAKGSAKVVAGGEARVDGDTIKLGSEGSAENLVLGVKLINALSEFVNILNTFSPAIGFPYPLGPVPMNPALLAALKLWQTRYCLTASTSPILSQDKFTER